MSLYPFKFTSILKPVIWGGNKICSYKNLDLDSEGIGESWEISVVPENTSIVANGDMKGQSLTNLIDKYQEKLLGQKVISKFGLTFPLLIKFIDAKQDLSIQVHPDDKLAKERHNSFGKTEMWYVINNEKEAYLYLGFNQPFSPEQYVKSVQDNTFTNYLQKYSVKPGDVFFLPAGRVHAISGGCFIAEIQQSSDITYRIYDYNRKDKHGNLRELHMELAKDAIDYKFYPEDKISYKEGEKVESLIKSDYFITNLIAGKKGEVIHLTHENTFVTYICIEGELKLTDNKGNSIKLKRGETVLIPAENSHLITLLLKNDSKLLETYL